MKPQLLNFILFYGSPQIPSAIVLFLYVSNTFIRNKNMPNFQGYWGYTESSMRALNIWSMVVGRYGVLTRVYGRDIFGVYWAGSIWVLSGIYLGHISVYRESISGLSKIYFWLLCVLKIPKWWRERSLYYHCIFYK